MKGNRMTAQSQYNTSVVLTEEQARYCEQKSAEMTADVGVPISRSAVIRLAIDELMKSRPVRRERAVV